MTAEKTTTLAKARKIDARGKSLGRLASEVARYLQGKHKPTWVPHIDSGESVQVSNLSEAKFTGKKFEQKEYCHHSGYPGGLKTKTLKELWAKSPRDVFRQVVWQMLPKNKLRKTQISRLRIDK